MTTRRQSSEESINDANVRSTNIEVCVRVRPLAVSPNAPKFFEMTPSPSCIRPPSRLSHPVTSRRTPPRPQKSSGGLDDGRPAWDVIDNDTVMQSASTTRIQGRTLSYTLDRVYGVASKTADIYQESLGQLVQSAMDGYHASMFAYGQTSTGKTHTMTGTKESPGIIPLAVEDCFRLIETTLDDDPREYLLRVSYMEIYNEQIIDLLSENPQPIRIFESQNGDVLIRGLREEVVSSPAHVFSLICGGEQRRQVGSTNMNKHSSRSHTIFRVWIESRSSAHAHSNVRISSLSLVDLAGSESVRLSGSTGERRKEGQYINKSLMTLGQVVFKLSETKRTSDQTVHIPYRDSKLTRLLQPSLSGNAQIVVICNISPQASHLEESHNTLKFATRAKRIQQKAIRTEVTDERSLLQSYREEIEDLKEQLRQSHAAQATAFNKNGDDDTRELVEAIQKMERLILKTKNPSHPTQLPDNRSTDKDSIFLLDEGPKTPVQKEIAGDEHLVDELHRIQGLLSTVLVKRSIFSTPERLSPQRDNEVEELRAQLHEKEVATSLRKADSSFLQSQLAEKDVLLAEVSKFLETVEKRQVELEAENAFLKDQLSRSEEDLALLRRSREGLPLGVEQLQNKLSNQESGLVVSNGSHADH